MRVRTKSSNIIVSTYDKALQTYIDYNVSVVDVLRTDELVLKSFCEEYQEEQSSIRLYIGEDSILTGRKDNEYFIFKIQMGLKDDEFMISVD